MDLYKDSKERFDAVKYEVSELEKVCSEKRVTAGGFDAKQAFSNVCSNMEALGDWFIHDGICTKDEWNTLLKNNPPLFAVSKINIQNKHVKADAQKWQNQANQINHHQPEFIVYLGSECGVTPKHTIDIDGTTYDSVDLAKQALNIVEQFYLNHGGAI